MWIVTDPMNLKPLSAVYSSVTQKQTLKYNHQIHHPPQGKITCNQNHKEENMPPSKSPQKKIKPSNLSNLELKKLVKDATIVEKDTHGAKVYHLSDDRYLKIFRRKSLFSSALFYPYSQRFIDNANTLDRLGIPTIKPTAHYRLEQHGTTAVLYTALKGETLRNALRNGTSKWEDLTPKLAKFIADLHDKGIYFRSLHLGNIVECKNKELGLIDIADMRVHQKPLSNQKTLRNLEHFKRYIDHEEISKENPTEELFKKIIDIRLKRKNDLAI